MKNIMLHAYCANNLGDDLFIKHICSEFPNVNFHIQIDGEFASGLSQIENLTLHQPCIIGRVLNRISKRWVTREHLAKRCDGLIHVGGSVFIQNENWCTKYESYRRMLSYAKKIFVIGANFGPYYTEDYLKAYKSLIQSQMDGICFRDSYSYRLFSDSRNVSWAPDILFAPDYSKYTSEGNRAIISLMDKGEAYISKMAELGDALRRDGYDVILMSFCYREGDIKACIDVSERMEAPCKIYSYTGDIEEALFVLGGAALIVSCRFHSMILGWAMGKRVFPIVYSEKMSHVIEDIYPSCDFCYIENIHELDAQRVLRTENFPGNLTELKICAGKHIELIRGLME